MICGNLLNPMAKNQHPQSELHAECSATISGPHSSKRPTLKTIAGITGLAVATVSRALKDAPDIGEATKLRVREAAKDIGYRPNRAGVRLRTGKTNVICLVMSAESHLMNHTAQLIHSVSTALRGTSYHLIVTPYSKDDNPMDPIRYIVETGSADGVILNQIEPDDPRVQYLSENGIPFATHGRTDMGLVHSWFDFDNLHFAELGVMKLETLGRKNLVLLSPPVHQSYGRHMVNGFVIAAQQLGIRHTVLENITSDSDMSAIEADIKRILDGPNPPDGFISGSTNAAMAIVKAVEGHDLKLGRDVDIVAKEALDFLRHFRREIIVVNEDVTQAGTFLVSALLDSIENGGLPQQGVETPILPP